MDRRAAVEKVKKLLRRARVNPGHEADTALALAKELIQKFALFEVEVEPQETSNVLLESKAEQWKEILAFGVAQAFQCRVFKKSTGELYVAGGQSAISLVLDLYVSLRDYALNSCARKVPVSLPVHDNITYVATLLDKVWTNRFLYGFAKTISDRLADGATTPHSQSAASPPPPAASAPQARAAPTPSPDIDDLPEEAPDDAFTSEDGAEPAGEAASDDRYATDAEDAEEEAATADLGDETRTEQAEQVANDMVAQGLALIREFSRGWSLYYAAQYAEGIYNLAFGHGKAAGSIVDLDTRTFVSRRQLAC
jgi:hypothetical protein